MELRQLEYFCMVSKLSNFTKAAEQLYVSQPAITKAIRNLEEELALTLFYRDKKRVVLTLEGQLFLVQAEKILHTVQQAVAELANCTTKEKGTINLAVPPMIGADLFPDIFTKFTRAYPHINLVVTEDGSVSSLDRIKAGELELGIIILPDNSDSICSFTVTEEEYLLCVPRGHALARETAVDFCQLRSEKFILLKPGFYQHHAIINRCLNKNFMPEIIFSSSYIRTIKSLIANGSGVSFLMRMSTQNDPQVITIPLTEPIKVQIGVVWKDGAPLSPACKAFIRFVKNWARTCPHYSTRVNTLSG